MVVRALLEVHALLGVHALSVAHAFGVAPLLSVLQQSTPAIAAGAGFRAPTGPFRSGSAELSGPAVEVASERPLLGAWGASFCQSVSTCRHLSVTLWSGVVGLIPDQGLDRNSPC